MSDQVRLPHCEHLWVVEADPDQEWSANAFWMPMRAEVTKRRAEILLGILRQENPEIKFRLVLFTPSEVIQ